MRASLLLSLAFSALLVVSALPLSAQTGSGAAAKPAAKPAPVHRTVPATSKPAVPKSEAPLTTDEQKTIYALGLSVYRSLGPFSLTPAELAIVQRAMSDAQAGKPAEDIQTWGPKIGPMAQQRTTAAGKAVLDKAVAEPGASKTESGLVYRQMTPGSGANPKATDTVRVNYRGTLPDGTEFDSSYKRNEPAEFPLNQVIPCWTEGLQKMKVGEKAVLTCPSNIAYGAQGHPPVIPGGAVLRFEVELLGIGGGTPAPGQPQVPGAPAAPLAPQQ